MSTGIRLLLAINVLSVFLFGCNGKNETQKEERKIESKEVVTLSKKAIKQISLAVETVKMEKFTGYLAIPAKVLANQDHEAQIGSLVQGRVSEVLIKVGDLVRQGQIIMYVEGLEIGELKAGYLKAKANYDYTKADLERHKLLLNQNIGSKQSYYEAEAENLKAFAEFQAEDKKIHSVGLSDEDVSDGKTNSVDDHTAGKLAVRSPINGIVVERNVVIGQLVDAATNAFKVINTNNVWVDGQIYEKDIAKINQKIIALFTSSTYPGEKFNGRIIYIGQTVNEQTRTITIRGEFPNSNNKLKPQMFGELQVQVNANAKAIMIPEEAVIREAEKEFVFLQTNDTTFEQRKVITGIPMDNKIEIKEGLKEGDKVVSKGVFYLKSEMKKDELTGE